MNPKLIPLAFLSLGLCLACAKRPTKFDRVEWRVAAANCGAGTRVAMKDDLLATQRLEGMTHDEIENLLGHDEKPTTKKELRFCLAPDKAAGGGKLQYLVITFDHNAVTGTSVITE